MGQVIPPMVIFDAKNLNHDDNDGHPDIEDPVCNTEFDSQQEELFW